MAKTEKQRPIARLNQISPPTRAHCSNWMNCDCFLHMNGRQYDLGHIYSQLIITLIRLYQIHKYICELHGWVRSVFLAEAKVTGIRPYIECTHTRTHFCCKLELNGLFRTFPKHLFLFWIQSEHNGKLNLQWFARCVPFADFCLFSPHSASTVIISAQFNTFGIFHSGPPSNGFSEI